MLFFSDDKKTQGREIVEWMRRLEVQADAAYRTHGWEKPRRCQWRGGEEGIARIRRWLDSGAHDVFQFHGVSPDGLPAAVKQDLPARGWIEARHITRGNQKRGYHYRLTPDGLDQKARLADRWLQRKRAEYQALLADLEQLRAEVQAALVGGF